MLMLFIFGAQADGAPYYCSCGRGMAVAALRSTLPPTLLLGCRCYSHAVLFCFSLFRRFAALPHIPTALLNFGGVACRTWCTSSANSPRSSREEDSLFLGEGKWIAEDTFSQTLLRLFSMRLRFELQILTRSRFHPCRSQIETVFR